ncbi:hypothetical protein B0T21DRAFT_411259 [Apiosordaria backusii]|uniref:Uncharacterized protein n=1 Tax=Apiosordaria backusii TaxID=314023 RepID=A0AA40EHI2_9PEZI|nr:hypothetical protein B0T21DRAFT_411259 [Apiosordaria backusii]
MDAGAHEPWIPNFDGNSPWRWEWWKFGMAPEDLFTTLDAQYNTAPFRIQGNEAFHHDVSEVAREAKTLDDFHAKLALRRDERLQELRKAWDGIFINMLYKTKVFDRHPHRWSAFGHFVANHSLDSLVLFFNSLLPSSDPTAPSLRGRRPSGSASAKSSQTESPLPDTAPASPTGCGGPAHSLPHIHTGGDFEDQKEPRSDENRQGATGSELRPRPPAPPPPSTRPPPPPPPPRRTTTRHWSAQTLTKDAGIAKRRHGCHPSRQGATDPAQRGKGSLDKKLTTTRTSRRLAGKPPEYDATG